MRPLPLVVTAAAVMLSACASDEPATAVPEGSVRAELGGVPLVLEVADSPQERAAGLMGRQQVPPGTGMLFRFDQPVVSRFYMYRVPVPLTAVFVRDGRVVHTVVMPPCTEQDPQACPRYGPESAFDTVVETAPETLERVRPGDTLTIEGEAS